MTTDQVIQQTRRIKVNQIFYDYTPKKAPPYSIAEPVPWITMKGKWLKKAGFTIDAPITVKVSEGCLILTTE